MNIMFLQFSDINYLKEKIRVYLKVNSSKYQDTEAVIDYIASTVYQNTMDFSIADEEIEMKKLSYCQVSEIKQAARKVSKLVSFQYPLVKYEYVIKDRVSYLLSEYETYPVGTPVLIRVTNKATMVHFFDCCIYEKGNLNFIQQPEEKEIVAPVLAGVDPFILSFFTGMISELGSKTGSIIFDKIFPGNSTDMRSMFDKLQNNIKTIFRDELDQKQIDDLEYQLTGNIKYMQEVYNPKKASKIKEHGELTIQDRKELIELLQPINIKMYTETMALLIGERYRAKGISYLVTGANAHLGIIQEMVNVDPNTTDPNKSSYMETYYMRLEGYIQALDRAIDEVYNKRLTYLGCIEESVLKGAATYRCWFSDFWANYKSDEYGNTKKGYDYIYDADKKCNAARNKYFNEVFHPTIVIDLRPYNDTKNSWISLRRK